jgi:tetratricopeptide (TPR) repeat protein
MTMQALPARRTALTSHARRAALALSALLSACAAGDPPGSGPAAATLVHTNNAHGAAYGAFLAAGFAEANNDTAAAASLFGAALDADPGNPQLLADAFIASLASGSPQAAVLAPRLPGNPLAYLVRGDQAAAKGNYAAAASLYEQLPQSGLPALVRPLLLAWCAAGEHHAAAAVDALSAHVQDVPFGPVYALNAALIADAAGDTTDAGKFYAAAGNAYATPNLRLAEILASWKARQGQPDAGRALLQSMAASHPALAIALPALTATMGKPVVHSPADGIAEAYLALAGSLDDPSEALVRVVLLRQALMLRPDLTPARLLLADTLDQSGQTAAALALLEPVSDTDALWAPVELRIAALRAELNRAEGAVAALDAVAKAYPNAIDPLEEAGDILRSAGDNARAKTYYDRAIALLPQPAPAGAWSLYYSRAIVEDLSKDWTSAEADLRAALALQPDQPYVLNYLAYSWALRGQHLDQADRMLHEAVGLAPKEGAIVDSLGYVKLREGQTGDAVKLLTQATEMDPDDAEVNSHLGDAFWAAGDSLAARYQWSRALALKPDPTLAASIEDKLKHDHPPS